jgi:hypothetical protein
LQNFEAAMTLVVYGGERANNEEMKSNGFVLLAFDWYFRVSRVLGGGWGRWDEHVPQAQTKLHVVLLLPQSAIGRPSNIGSSVQWDTYP